jgi:F0F1-type ATP synthase assembly protein I
LAGSAFLTDDGKTVNEVCHEELTVDGDLTFQKVCQDHHTVLAFDTGHVGQDDVFCTDLVTVYGGKTHKGIPPLAQRGQNGGQTKVTLLELGDSAENLLCGKGIAQLSQLLGQLCQLLGMGHVVLDHIVHEGNGLLHGVAGSAAATALLVTVMVVMLVVMIMMMLMAMVVGMLVGMLMVVAVTVAVFVMIANHCLILLNESFSNPLPCRDRGM